MRPMTQNIGPSENDRVRTSLQRCLPTSQKVVATHAYNRISHRRGTDYEKRDGSIALTVFPVFG